MRGTFASIAAAVAITSLPVPAASVPSVASGRAETLQHMREHSLVDCPAVADVSVSKVVRLSRQAQLNAIRAAARAVLECYRSDEYVGSSGAAIAKPEPLAQIHREVGNNLVVWFLAGDDGHEPFLRFVADAAAAGNLDSSIPRMLMFFIEEEVSFSRGSQLLLSEFAQLRTADRLRIVKDMSTLLAEGYERPVYAAAPRRGEEKPASVARAHAEAAAVIRELFLSDASVDNYSVFQLGILDAVESNPTATVARFYMWYLNQQLKGQ